MLSNASLFNTDAKLVLVLDADWTTRRQNYGVNNAQTQNKIVDVLSLTNSLLPRAYNTDAKTNEVTSQNAR